MTSISSTTVVYSLEHVLYGTLIQLCVIILAARVAGTLARRLGQPRAVGEIAAGLMLGPSLLGWLAPDVFAWMFKSVDAMPLSVMSQLGLILLMFQVGLEFDFQQLQGPRTRNAVVAVAVSGILLPFALGLGFAWFSADVFAISDNRVGYLLFLATALSITAVPILGRIMMEYRLTETPIGVVTITSAAINDAIGWVILAMISAAVTTGFEPGMLTRKLLLLGAYVAVSWFAVRSLLRRIIVRFPLREDNLPQDLMAVLLAAIFVSALATSSLGIFAIFGGFMLGMILHDQRTLVIAWRNQVAPLVNVLFLPVFFTFTGLRTNVGALDSALLWAWFCVLFTCAVAGKFGGCYVGARVAGMTHFEACNVGIMMNTRALMELIVVNIGFDLGVISPPMFTMLVLIAIGSTITTAPGLRRWLPAIGHQLPVGSDG